MLVLDGHEKDNGLMDERRYYYGLVSTVKPKTCDITFMILPP